LVDQARKRFPALVAFIRGDPLLQVVDVLVFILFILQQVILRGLISDGFIRLGVVVKPVIHFDLDRIISLLTYLGQHSGLPRAKHNHCKRH
jgi:hypothetical protein